MQKKNFSKFFLVAGLAVAGLLSSCGESANSVSRGGPVYTVNFFDENGVQVGYAYAVEGRPAFLRKMDEGQSYDYLPHSDLELSTPGARYEFSGWQGTYDTDFDSRVGSELNGKAVDLSEIKANCNVTATFAEKLYKVEARFKNGVSAFGDAQIVDYGQAIAFPTTNPEEAHPEYYNTYAFEGWSLSKDDTAAIFENTDTLSYKWKSGADANQFAWGLGAPEATAAVNNKGVIYLDKTLTDHMPTYPTYISDGSKWVELGNLSKGTLPLEFEAAYETTKKDFRVTLYDATGYTDELTHFDVQYGKTLTFEREVLTDTTKFTVKVDDVTKYLYEIATPGNKYCYDFEGVYENAPDLNQHSSLIENTKMSFTLTYEDGTKIPNGCTAKVQGNVNIRPLIKEA